MIPVEETSTNSRIPGRQPDEGRVNNTSGGLDVQTSLIKVGGPRSQGSVAPPALFVATPTSLIRTTMSIIQVSPCRWYNHLTRWLPVRAGRSKFARRTHNSRAYQVCRTESTRNPRSRLVAWSLTQWRMRRATR